MNDTSAALAVLAGLAIRLMIPILLTAVLVLVLSRLDKRWQDEGHVAPLEVEKPECWKTQRCAPARREDCPGYRSKAPCWQAFRHRDGYLDPKCLGCPVLAMAPAPSHA